MDYLSGFNLKASTTARRAEVSNPPCSVKSLFTVKLFLTFVFGNAQRRGVIMEIVLKTLKGLKALQQRGLILLIICLLKTMIKWRKHTP